VTDPDFGAKVRQQRDAQHPPSPRDRVLWCLMKGQQRAEAVVRLIDGLGTDLRYLWNGDLRASQVYRNDVTLHSEAAKMREGLIGRGWVDAPPMGGTKRGTETARSNPCRRSLPRVAG
jgi:hypothetical protein